MKHLWLQLTEQQDTSKLDSRCSYCNNTAAQTNMQYNLNNSGNFSSKYICSLYKFYQKDNQKGSKSENKVKWILKKLYQGTICTAVRKVNITIAKIPWISAKTHWAVDKVSKIIFAKETKSNMTAEQNADTRKHYKCITLHWGKGNQIRSEIKVCSQTSLALLLW